MSILIIGQSYAGHTFINWWQLVLAGLIGGVVCSLPVLWLNKVAGAIFVFILGAFSANIFLLFNGAYADSKSLEIIKCPVVKKISRRGRYGPSINILYNGDTDSFFVDKNQLDSANYVTLTIKQGYFGYAFIDDYKITAE